MSEELTLVNQKLDEILKILNGNGHIGVCAKVSILWSVGIWVLVTIGAQAVIITKMLVFK